MDTMKKLPLLIFFLLSNLILSAQIDVSGVVYDLKENPLEGASVYLNNTTIGTTTNANGKFSLQVPEGTFKLIVSYLGFESQSFGLSTKDYRVALTFRLKERSNVLNEVVIKNRKKLTIDQKKDFFRLFQREFIGTSKVAQRCRILNKEVLEYDFDPRTQNLNITASEPIRISNPSLGYVLHYDLRVFQVASGIVYYAGNMRFEEVEASKKKKRRLRKNRLRAYYGSFMHFLRSIVDDNMQNQGFVVHQVRRIPLVSQSNEDRMKSAKEYEYRQEVVQLNLVPHDYSRLKNGAPSLRFTDYLRVSYTHELPDENYPQRNEYRHQESLLSIDGNEVGILKQGVLQEPLKGFVLGYWSFEKVGDTLPLNFKP